MGWPWGMTKYQWLVVFAAWLGWGFDAVDALLFNYVAENCIPTLLEIPLHTPEAAKATQLYTGLLTSILLLGWAAGGVFFGWLADRIGRSKTMILTILVYSLGTALCAFAPNIYFLILFRIIASLGIGGEWAAGAAMVAEVVPKERRVEAGALLYTSAPFGIVGAALINKFVAGWWLVGHPEYSWRVVFLFGLLPALAAAALRFWLKEPEIFEQEGDRNVRFGDLFGKEIWPLTRSGVLMAVTALLGWWTLGAFNPPFTGAVALEHAKALGLTPQATAKVVADWKLWATALFSFGALVGTLLTVPVAKRWGRKAMFRLYFGASIVVIWICFGLGLSPLQRLLMQIPLGITVFGVLGSFTYYLPELFPTRLRATGAGFCYNIGRVITAFGPFFVGTVAKGGVESMQRVMFWMFLVPLVGLFCMPWVVETRPEDFCAGGSSSAS